MEKWKMWGIAVNVSWL